MEIKDRELSGLSKEAYRTIDYIVIDEIRELVLEVIEKHGTAEKLEKANKISDVLIDTLKRKKLINEQTHQSFVDIMLGAALLHNVFYKEDDWMTLFEARRVIGPIAEEMKINKQAIDALLHSIEGQLGEQTPVPECIPKPGTPTELFATTVWFVDKYLS